MVIKDKKIAQVCQAKNSGRNQQMCEQCVFKKMIWKQKGKTAMVINNEAKLLGKQQEIKTKRNSGLPERGKPE